MVALLSCASEGMVGGAGVGLWLVVMGGRTADVGWFRTKTDTFLNDVVVMDRCTHTQ